MEEEIKAGPGRKIAMKARGLLVACVVLAALIGALYWSDHHKPAEDKTASANVAPKVLSLKQDDITKLTIKKNAGEPSTLVKNSQWAITAPHEYPADQDVVKGMLSTLSNLNSDRLITDKADNLNQYGLNDPTIEVEITNKDGKSNTLLIGDKLPAGGGSYAALSGDPRVFSVANYNTAAIDKNLDDLRDKRLLTMDADKVSRIELVKKNQYLEFGRSKDDWRIIKPRPLRANSFQVGDLVRQLTNAKMDLNTPALQAKGEASAYAAGAPVATAKLTDASSTQELHVRKSKNDYYAKSSIAPGVYKISDSLGKDLDKSLEDFRNKKLFDFGYADPNKVELHDGAKAYYLTRSSNGDWWNGNSKKMDTDSAQSFLDRVRDLAASSFPDTGFASPSITLKVTSDDGKRVEQILIAKAGKNYIATRENEPSLYQLDSISVDDLLKSAGDMKEATPPAAAKK